jgi:hypothetical protein
MVFGGGSSNDVEIKVKVDDSGVITTFDKLGNKLSEVETASKDASAGFSATQASLISLQAVANLTQIAIAGLTGAFAVGLASIRKGSEIDDIASSFENLSKQAGATSDVLLNKLNQATGETISNFDLMKQANELLIGGIAPDKFELLAKAARSLGEATGTSAKEGMEALSDSLLRGNDRALKTLGIVIDNTAAEKEYAEQLGKTREQLTEQERVFALREASLNALAEQQARLGDVTNDASDKLDQLTKIVSDSKDEFLRSAANNAQLNQSLDQLIVLLKNIDFSPLIQGLAQAISAASIAAKKIIEFASAVNAFVNKSSAFDRAIAKNTTGYQLFSDAQEKIIDLLSKDTKAATEEAIKQYDKLGKIYTTLGKSGELLDSQINVLNEEFAETRKQIEGSARSFGILNTGQENAQEEADKLTKEIQKSADAFIKQSSEANKAAGVIQSSTKKASEAAKANPIEIPIILGGKRLGEDGGGSTIDQSFFNDISGALGASLGDALATALSGGDVREAIRRAGSSLGGQLGQSLGAATGSPFVAALAGPIGEALGDKVFEAFAGIGKDAKSNQKAADMAAILLAPVTGGLSIAINEAFGDKLFGSDSQGTKTRKAIDKFFADAFDANRLAVIIDGQLSVIRDLDLGGGLFGDTDSGAGQFFSGLSESAQAAFTGVASGFTSLLGVGQEAAQGLAIALSDNLGGSLNNLQLLVQASGVSFEQLRESAVNAFLDGKLSALEAQSALSAIANIAQDGIPDGIGFTVQAFENLQAAGSKGGRALIDALKDIGFEARELGIRDFGGLIANITASGQFSQQEIQQVFNTLRENGINSIDELVNATNEQLIPTLASLEAQGFLTEASNETAALIDSINQIPEEKNLTVNVKTNFDNNTIAANNAGIFSLPSNSIN